MDIVLFGIMTLIAITFVLAWGYTAFRCAFWRLKAYAAREDNERLAEECREAQELAAAQNAKLIKIGYYAMGSNFADNAP